MSFTCSECDGEFCTQHRLPEEHDCQALRTKSREEWFKEDLSVRRNRQSESIRRNSEQPQNTVDADDEEKLACLWCDEPTSRVCPDCGDPYCADHEERGEHNCAFLETQEDLCEVENCGEDTITSCEDCGENFCYKHYPSKKHDCAGSTRNRSEKERATVSESTRERGGSWLKNQPLFVLLISALIFLGLLLIAL
jgi:predicted nucleic acid binding AN1-type Zn finger protein